MKRSSLIPFVLLCFQISLYADIAPGCGEASGNFKPMNNNDIQLFSETIDITLFDNYYAVEVNYVFKNHGSKQEVLVGFPDNSRFEDVYDFIASENGKQFEIETKQSDWEPAHQKWLTCDPTNSRKIDQFLCFSLKFDSSETKYIKNTYRGKYFHSYRSGCSRSFYYILTSGAFWKDKIHSAEVRLHATLEANRFDLSCSNFNGDEANLAGFSKKYLDFEPTKELSFSLYCKNDFIPYRASSSLDSVNNIGYDIYNILDGKQYTAWVEGAEGDGQGEWFEIYNPSRSPIKVSSISIVNGFNYNPEIYKQNGRVHTLKVTFSFNAHYYNHFYMHEDPHKKLMTKAEFIYELEDTPDIQILYLDYPIVATDIRFEIVHTYRGEKYEDTAISEVIVNTVEE